MGEIAQVRWYNKSNVVRKLGTITEKYDKVILDNEYMLKRHSNQLRKLGISKKIVPLAPDMNTEEKSTESPLSLVQP